MIKYFLHHCYFILKQRLKELKTRKRKMQEERKMHFIPVMHVAKFQLLFAPVHLIILDSSPFSCAAHCSMWTQYSKTNAITTTEVVNKRQYNKKNEAPDNEINWENKAHHNTFRMKTKASAGDEKNGRRDVKFHFRCHYCITRTIAMQIKLE